MSGKNRQKPCRSYFRERIADSAERTFFSMTTFVAQPLYLLMLIVFTSFLLFFGLLLWYADKHNKGIDIERPDKYRDREKQYSRSETLSGFDYFDPNCSQFPLNFPKTSSRSLEYTGNEAAKQAEIPA